jgi:NAD(P)H-dependent flavin oxidoreductase YrpB (nitropropane dioxygenase family)
MREGDLVEGELEIGQVASRIDALRPAADIVRETAAQCAQTLKRLC